MKTQNKKPVECAFCGTLIEPDEPRYTSEVTGETICQSCHEEEQLDMALEEEWL